MGSQDERKVETHRKIIEAAARIFRTKGYHSTTVAAVMREAGLTVGGFYAHFLSKEDLFTAAIIHAMTDSFSELEQYVTSDDPWRRLCQIGQIYLSPEHFAMIDEGCPAPSLLSEVARSGTDAQAAFTKLSLARSQRIADFFPPEQRDQILPVIHSIGCMAIGALTMARASQDPAYIEHTLNAAKQSIGLLAQSVAAKLAQGEDLAAGLPSEEEWRAEAEAKAKARLVANHI